MFERHPEVQNAFAKFKNFRTDHQDELFESTILKMHGMAVMSAIGDILDKIEDDGAMLEMLLEQGRYHAQQDKLAAQNLWVRHYWQPILGQATATMVHAFPGRPLLGSRTSCVWLLHELGK